MENDREIDQVLMNIRKGNSVVLSMLVFSAKMQLKLLSFLARMAKKGLVSTGIFGEYQKFLEKTGGKFEIYNIPISREASDQVVKLQEMEKQLEKEKDPVSRNQLKKQIEAMKKEIPEMEQLDKLGVSHYVLPKINGSESTIQVAVGKEDKEIFKNWFVNHVNDHLSGGTMSLKDLKAFTEGNYSIFNLPFEGEEVKNMLHDFDILGINCSVLEDLKAGDGFTQVAVANKDQANLEGWFGLWKESKLQEGEQAGDLQKISDEAYLNTAGIDTEDYIAGSDSKYKEANAEFEKSDKTVDISLYREQKDVKGDTQRKLGNTFKKAGYNVRSLNLKNPEKSDRYNPFVYIEKEDDLVRVVKALQDSVRPPQKQSSGDPFWDDGVKLYLQSLFYYEWLDARENNRVGSMNGILKLVNEEAQHDKNDPERTLLQNKMDEKADKYGASYPPVRDYRKLKEGAPDTVRSIVIMVNAMLALCETAEVRRIFEGNDINIREIGTGVGKDKNKKTILFLIIPDNNNAYNFLISLFYTQMFDILIRLSDDELHGPLPCRVETWMDEFYAGAKPADPDVLLGVVRSRNISMIPMLQSISQIKTLYQNDKWETIMDNVATVVYLGSGPMAEGTHKYISEALGKATIDTRTQNMNHGKNGSSGTNYNRSGRELMTPAEVKRMPRTECIIFLESRQPVYDEKSIPFDVPKNHYRSTEELRNLYKMADANGPYEHPVEVFYDSEGLRYFTLDPEEVITFPTEEEAEKIKESAKNNSHIQIIDIDEKQLAYLNFGEEKKSQDEIIDILQKALEEEQKSGNTRKPTCLS